MEQSSSLYVEAQPTTVAPTDSSVPEPAVATAIVALPAPVPALVTITIATESVGSSHASVGAVSMPVSSIRATTEPAATSDATAKPKAAPSNHKASAGMNGGRWTEQEHQSFLAGLRLYGREWKKVASKIKTRTSAQIRSHAQKYFAKLARDDELRRHGGAGGGALLPHPAFHPDGALAPLGSASLYGYFSDGGSSAAPNSGDEDTVDTDAKPASEAVQNQRRPPQKRLAPAPSTAAAVGGSPAAEDRSIVAAAPATAFPYRPATHISSSSTKKRSRSRSPSDSSVVDSTLTNGSWYQADAVAVKQCRLAASKPVALELLPSQEELIEKASPNVRRRLSSLIEAELCALQVLSCYAMLQQHSQRQSAAGHSPSF